MGGGEGLEGVYGSISKTGTTEILEAFKVYAGMGKDSVMLDIGSGLGRCAGLQNRLSACAWQRWHGAWQPCRSDM